MSKPGHIEIRFDVASDESCEAHVVVVRDGEELLRKTHRFGTTEDAVIQTFGKMTTALFPGMKSLKLTVRKKGKGRK